MACHALWFASNVLLARALFLTGGLELKRGGRARVSREWARGVWCLEGARVYGRAEGERKAVARGATIAATSLSSGI